MSILAAWDRSKEDNEVKKVTVIETLFICFVLIFFKFQYKEQRDNNILRKKDPKTTIYSK